MISRLISAVALVFAACAVASAEETAAHRVEGALVATHSAHGHIPVRSWKTLRDARIVKQDLDYSCGAASLATLLNEFYGQSVTEEALLRAMDKGDGRAQFLAMWDTRADADDGLAGKFLAVLPANAMATAKDDFFSKTPLRQSAPAVEQLAIRAWP